jgi:hypothetical protein
VSYLGAIEEAGASPYKISGDPVTALIAQLNRFAGRTVSPPGGVCGATKYVVASFPLGPIATPQAADAAALLVWRRYSCAPRDTRSASKEKWAADGLFGGNTWAFVMNNLVEITTTIAQFGDSIGLDPATVGITERDPKMTPKFPVMTVALLGALAAAAFVVSRRKR